MADDGITLLTGIGTTEFGGFAGNELPGHDTFDISGGGTIDVTPLAQTQTIHGTLESYAGYLTDNTSGFRSTPDLLIASDGTLIVSYEGFAPGIELDNSAFIRNEGTASLNGPGLSFNLTTAMRFSIMRPREI